VVHKIVIALCVIALCVIALCVIAFGFACGRLA
jgi:hypothetical protein